MGQSGVILELERVEPATAIDFWPSILGELERHPETWNQTETAESILERLAAGRLQLWVILDEQRKVRSMLMTRVIEYPKGPCLQIVWGSGQSMADLLPVREGIETLAERAGFVRIEVVGRMGWTKELRGFGYSPAYVVVARDLTRPPKNKEN